MTVQTSASRQSTHASRPRPSWRPALAVATLAGLLAHAAPVAASPALGITSLVTYNWRPATQLPHYLAAKAAVAAKTPGAVVRIVTFGDSTTQGINADNTGGSAALNHSYPADLIADLGQITGVPAQNINFQGYDIDSGTLGFFGPNFTNATAYGGIGMAGGNAITTSMAGQGFVFTLAQPGTFDTLNVSYFDGGSSTATVTVNGGPSGSVSKTLQFGNSGNILTQTIHLPAGTYSGLTLTAGGATYLEGVSFSNSTAPTFQLFNAGVGGAWSSSVGNGTDSGTGEFPGGLGLAPSLALINYGINDILDNYLTPAQTVANFKLMVLETRAAKCDPIIIIPQPFGLNPYLPPPMITSLDAVRDGLKTLALQLNVPVIDLSATYGDSYQTLIADNLLNSPHPNAALYADIAARIAVLLTGSGITSFPNTAGYLVPGTQAVSGTRAHDILFGNAPINMLTGNGGWDTYAMRATDQQDTIINGWSGYPHPAGQLDVTAANHTQLWLTQSGNNLVVGILGTTRQVIVQNWFASPSAQLRFIIGGDTYTIGLGIPALLQAMAIFQAANPGFNPQTTPYTSTSASYYGSALINEGAKDWFR